MFHREKFAKNTKMLNSTMKNLNAMRSISTGKSIDFDMNNKSLSHANARLNE